MKNLRILFCFLIFLFFCPFILLAQELKDSTWGKIEMHDGNIYIGQIIKQKEETIWLSTKLISILMINRGSIKALKPLVEGELRRGTYNSNNPFSTKYLIAPTAYGLKSGEGYYQNNLLISNSLSVGITKNIEVGGGFIFLPLFRGFENRIPIPYWFSTKITFPLEKDYFNVGIGGTYANFINGNESGGGWTYGLATIGGRDNNITGGLGWTYGFNSSLSGAPTIMLSFSIRGSGKISFVSENYMVSLGEDLILALSGSGRFIGEKIKMDFGFLLLTNIADDIVESFFPFPWLSFAQSFGGKKK